VDAKAADRAFQFISGFRVAQVVRAVAELRIPDLVSDAPRSAADLAAATGMLEDPLWRIMRALVSLGMFTEDEDHRFGATAVSECFTDRPGSMRVWALMIPRESDAAFGEVRYTLRTGKPGYEKLFGKTSFEWLSDNPNAAALFNLGMQRSTEQIAAKVVEAYDFAHLENVIDVGGGTGALLAAILRANPHLRGAVFDLPTGLSGADTYLVGEGVRTRCDVIAGSFLEAVPPGYDLYLLKNIIHDWDDEQACGILRTCRDAMGERSRLLLVERMAPDRALCTADARQVLLMDLHMMVMLGGRERNIKEFTAILALAGLELTRVIPTDSYVHLIEAVPVTEPSRL
jgi:orsellinic acid C2-O-methyltransferase